MAQHGYLREYDEGWDRGENRDRWREEDRERGWRGSDRDWSDRDESERSRNFMLGNRDRGWERDRDYERGYLGSSRDEFRNRFRDDDREFRGTSEGHRDPRSSTGLLGSRFSGDRQHSPRHFSSRQDDHYLSWRDRQMDALDRDYADYCREREAQFHQDFDTWRSQRHGNPEPLRTGMTQTGLSADPTGELQLTSDEAIEPATGPDPTATATLGTSGDRGGR